VAAAAFLWYLPGVKIGDLMELLLFHFIFVLYLIVYICIIFLVIVLRIVETTDHWAILVGKRGSSVETSSFVVFDGLYCKEIMEASKPLQMHLLTHWFGDFGDLDKSSDCNVAWGRCAGQNDSWSCGHRVLLVFEALCRKKVFETGNSVHLHDIILIPEDFDSLSSKCKFEAMFSEHIALQATPQRKKRAIPEDFLAPSPDNAKQIKVERESPAVQQLVAVKQEVEDQDDDEVALASFTKAGGAWEWPTCSGLMNLFIFIA